MPKPLQGLTLAQQVQWYNKQLRDAPWPADLDRLYVMLGDLARAGARTPLGECLRAVGLPKRGLYFFFESGEHRKHADCSRIVRVGTHAVSMGSSSSLRSRLRSHLGTNSGTGSHRSSVFRSHVGAAMAMRDSALRIATWGIGSSAPEEIRLQEALLEQHVSAYMNALEVSWIEVDDEASPRSDRAILERHLIALLSNCYHPVDPPSPAWLGNHSSKLQIRESGLWNVNHTEKRADTRVLDLLEFYVGTTLAGTPIPRQSQAGRFMSSLGRQPMPFD